MFLAIVDLKNPIDLSIPLRFHSPQPNAFFLPKASASPVATKTFVGDVKKGGSCNCYRVQFVPHGNGTHTESIGHLTRNIFPIGKILLPPLIPATLISIALCKKRGDWVVEKKNLEKILKKANSNFLEALVVRTLPNPPSKKRKNYSGTNPPYFSPDAVRFLNQLGVKHLLIDLPSLDKENDPHLTSHRIFWNLKGKNASPKTITEMIYVENKIVDGIYFLNLQIPNFFLDAAPSRPILFRVKKQAYAKK